MLLVCSRMRSRNLYYKEDCVNMEFDFITWYLKECKETTNGQTWMQTGSLPGIAICGEESFIEVDRRILMIFRSDPEGRTGEFAVRCLHFLYGENDVYVIADNRPLNLTVRFSLDITIVPYVQSTWHGIKLLINL